ncbi:MAG: hypothetical protein GX604_08670 [Actinobacteria bacterium]|nr:hypothetical protein [Actinomycetota bacterium]
MRVIPGTGSSLVNAWLGLGIVMVPVVMWCGALVWVRAQESFLILLGCLGVLVVVACVWRSLPCLAALGQVAVASGIGLILGRQFRRAWWLGIAAIAAFAADLWSVLAGPTHLVLEKAPAALNYLLIQVPALGGATGLGLGTSDILFLCLFLEGARVCRLRVGWSLAAMLTGLMVATGLAVAAGVAVPVLPLLTTGFVSANVDLILRDIRGSLRS